MNCLVTGGAGFIGSNLALELERLGHTITVLDNFTTGNRGNLGGFEGKVITGDVTTHAFKEKFSAIFHQAAITDPRHPDDDKVRSENLAGFQSMVRLAKACDAKLVYASTANLYGNGKVPMEEDQEKDITCAYGQSKLMMDEQAQKLAGSMHIVGLRYFNVFGPGESHKGRAASMIYHLAKQMKSGKSPKIFRMGEQKRDHIYVKDVVQANLHALEAPSGVYNVGTGIGTTFNQVVDAINKALGTKLKPDYIDMPYDQKTYQMNTQANTKLAEKTLKFRAKWTFQDAVSDYVRMLP